MLYKYCKQTRDFRGFYILSLVYFFYILGAFLITQLFHLRLPTRPCGPHWPFTIPTRAPRIIIHPRLQ